MSAEPTIVVRSFFGDKELTKEEYMKEWTDHMRQLFYLSSKHYDEFRGMSERVEEIASLEFDRMYDLQELKRELH